MKKSTLAVMAIAGLLGASTAVAGDDGLYLLGEVGRITGNGGQSLLDHGLTAAGAVGFSSSVNAPTLYKLQAGYQINRNWAVEGGYLGADNAHYSAAGGSLRRAVTGTASINGWDLTAVGILPVSDKFSLLGKIGIADMQEKATTQRAGVSSSTSSTKTDLTYGIDAKYDFTDTIFMRVGLDSYNIGNSNYSVRNTMAMIAAGYKF
jgi:OOP family OmpA-OmpF porin